MNPQNNQKGSFHWKTWHSAAVVAALLALSGGAAYATINAQQSAHQPRTAQKTNGHLNQPKAAKGKVIEKKGKHGKAKKDDPVADAVKSVTDGLDGGAKLAEKAVAAVVGSNPLTKAVATLATPKNVAELAKATQDVAKDVAKEAQVKTGTVVELAQGGHTTATTANTASSNDATGKGQAGHQTSGDNGNSSTSGDTTGGKGHNTTGGGNAGGNSSTNHGGGSDNHSGGGSNVTPGGGGSHNNGGSGAVVTPVNMHPVIQVANGLVSVSLDDHQPNLLDGVEAFDAEDGDLSKKVKVTGNVNMNKLGKYVITYTVIDSGGLNGLATRTYEVRNDAPTITVPSIVRLFVGDNFTPLAHVTAADKQDGDLTSSVVYSGSVNTSKPGTYVVTYTVTDKNHASTHKQSQVIISAADATFTGIKPITIVLGSTFDPLAGVSVTDPYTPTDHKLTVSGKVDTKVVGDYELTYQHTDKFDHVTTAKQTVTVKAQDASNPSDHPAGSEASSTPSKPSTPVTPSKPSVPSSNSSSVSESHASSSQAEPSNPSTGSKTPSESKSSVSSTKAAETTPSVAKEQVSSSVQASTTTPVTEEGSR